MPDPRELVVEISGLEKDYRGLRPLRIRDFVVARGESFALLGFDAAAAEVLVNLITAATLPDRGEVRAFGQPTTAIQDAVTWLTSLDRFGIVSERAIVLDEMTVEQNLALTLSMALHDLSPEILAAVATAAAEVGFSGDQLGRIVSTLSPPDRLRLRLARALCPNPSLLLAEHPNASLSDDDGRAFAADYAQIVGARAITSVVVTADRAFATAIATQVFVLEPATGELKPLTAWRRWFG